MLILIFCGITDESINTEYFAFNLICVGFNGYKQYLITDLEAEGVWA